MPLFYRTLNIDGITHDMIEQPEHVVEAQAIVTPLSPTAGRSVGLKRYYCTACTPPKPFAGLGVLAIHFNKHHQELYTTKDSWRKYVGDAAGESHGAQGRRPYKRS